MRLNGFLRRLSEDAVSIHAPVKGATILRNNRSFGYLGFNPRTREGCDSLASFDKLLPKGFNPRTREGCDPLFVESIQFPKGFNPRTREGCDQIGLLETSLSLMFQSTHP